MTARGKVQKESDATEGDGEEDTAEDESDGKVAEEEGGVGVVEYEGGGDEDCDNIAALAAASVATCCKWSRTADAKRVAAASSSPPPFSELKTPDISWLVSSRLIPYAFTPTLLTGIPALKERKLVAVEFASTAAAAAVSVLPERPSQPLWF